MLDICLLFSGLAASHQSHAYLFYTQKWVKILLPTWNQNLPDDWRKHQQKVLLIQLMQAPVKRTLGVGSAVPATNPK